MPLGPEGTELGNPMSCQVCLAVFFEPLIKQYTRGATWEYDGYTDAELLEYVEHYYRTVHGASGIQALPTSVTTQGRLRCGSLPG